MSQDEQQGTMHYKDTFFIELAPICRDDLAILPKALSKKLGGLGPMVLVHKISQFVHLVDVKTM